MQLTRAAAVLIAITLASRAYADAECDAHAQTRDDFLACERADTDNTLANANKLYDNIRGKLTGDKLKALESNKSLWAARFRSDCQIVGYAFNDWSNEYAPDTDFQRSACEANVAKEELRFYAYISCPEDMETSATPECAAISQTPPSTKASPAIAGPPLK